MGEEPNPIKDILYESINELGEDYLQKNISKGNISETINEILFKTHNKVGNLEGDSNVNIGKLLTSLLHYLLTLILIPSQRKISKNDIDIDIVIPNLKTLETKPEEAILICIPSIHEMETQKQVKMMEEIQPIKENIWYVTENNLDSKTYSIKDNTISKIIDDINKFLSLRKTTQFRFFKA